MSGYTRRNTLVYGPGGYVFTDIHCASGIPLEPVRVRALVSLIDPVVLVAHSLRLQMD